MEAFLLVVQILFLIADFSFFCFSIIGNSVVIYVMSRNGNLKSKNYYILSVAFADLFIGLFGIPLGESYHLMRHCVLCFKFHIININLGIAGVSKL
jgi:hypothetical protein